MERVRHIIREIELEVLLVVINVTASLSYLLMAPIDVPLITLFIISALFARIVYIAGYALTCIYREYSWNRDYILESSKNFILMSTKMGTLSGVAIGVNMDLIVSCVSFTQIIPAMKPVIISVPIISELFDVWTIARVGMFLWCIIQCTVAGGLVGSAAGTIAYFSTK